MVQSESRLSNLEKAVSPWVGGGEVPCRMSIIRKGNVALSNLRKGCVALLSLRKGRVACR